MTSRRPLSALLAVMFCSVATFASGDDATKAYEEALALSDRLDDTEEGQAYEKRFFAA